MEGTSCGENCCFVKQGFCKSEKECPHYVESWWIEGQTEQHKLIKDCSPKRMLLHQQILQRKLENVQQALENSKNEYHNLCQYLKTLVGMSQQVLLENQKTEVKDEKFIPYSNSDDNRSCCY